MRRGAQSLKNLLELMIISMTIAGSDTVSHWSGLSARVLIFLKTTTVLETFFLAMSLNPDVQKEAQRVVSLNQGIRIPEGHSTGEAFRSLHATRGKSRARLILLCQQGE